MNAFIEPLAFGLMAPDRLLVLAALVGMAGVERVTHPFQHARDGQVAQDGNEANSPFAQALVQHLQESNLEISLLFRKVRDTVWSKTHGAQEPFTYGSLPAEALYFRAVAN